MTIVKTVLRIILGAFMLYAGIGHLSFLKEEFYAQVPQWITTDRGLMDVIVIASGVVEITLGVFMIIGRRFKLKTGLILALFFILIFPGNINQYVNGISAFGLDTNEKRLIRLFFQPVLILWALWTTGGLAFIINRNKE